MGRRGRARARAAAAAEAEAVASTGRPPRVVGRQLLAWLNPIKRGTRGRARFAAVTFGVLALMIAAAGAANGRPSLFRPAVLLGILAVVWAVRALTMPKEQEPDR